MPGASDREGRSDVDGDGEGEGTDIAYGAGSSSSGDEGRGYEARGKLKIVQSAGSSPALPPAPALMHPHAPQQPHGPSRRSSNVDSMIADTLVSPHDADEGKFRPGTGSREQEQEQEFTFSPAPRHVQWCQARRARVSSVHRQDAPRALAVLGRGRACDICFVVVVVGHDGVPA